MTGMKESIGREGGERIGGAGERGEGMGSAPWRLSGLEAQLNQFGVLGTLHKPLT